MHGKTLTIIQFSESVIEAKEWMNDYILQNLCMWLLIHIIISV